MTEIRGLPRIGDSAPDFEAVTTQASDFNFSVCKSKIGLSCSPILLILRQSVLPN